MLEKPRPSRLRRLVDVLVLVYVALILLYIGNRLIIQDRIWLVSLFSSFSLIVFLPLPVLLVFSLLTLSRRSLILLLPILIWLLVWIGPRFVPKSGLMVDANTPTLRVMTNNVSHFNAEPERIPALIVSQSPDIIFLQEVELSTESDVRAALASAYPYQSVQLDDMREGMYTAANLTYSRVPFVSSEQIDPRIPQMPLIYRNVIEHDEQQIALYNVHLLSPGSGYARFTDRINNYFIRYALDYDDTARNRQIDALLAFLADEPLPYIVAGDFNTSDFSMTYNQLTAQMNDSFAESGEGLGGSWPAARVFGWPAFIPPIIRIDYIWHSTGLQSVKAWQGAYTGSDHLSVFADLTLQK
ncbi:MAG: endonuclease/exonuclease/phosphatase family protein [Chloroflexi bacterium]|nr:endonuclease/exonuclease/phosphatase family protein [Chloroflexota bacterium]MCC6895949.1 endonuclease/exonuclease/phosphatase family protein [Anaerolineae bacterium]